MKKSALTLAIAVSFSALLPAQTNPNLETGFKPYGSYDISNVDSRNLMNGDLTVRIPILSYPQRGAVLPQVFSLRYNGKSFSAKELCGLAGCTSHWGPGQQMGMRIGFDTYGGSTTILGAPTLQHVESITDPSGGSHVLASSTPDPLHAGYTTLRAVEGSGYFRSSDCIGCFFKGCTNCSNLHENDPEWSRTKSGYDFERNQDLNGNFIAGDTTSKYVDTLGRNLLKTTVSTTDTTGCLGPRPVSGAATYSLPGPNGVPAQLRECDAAVKFNTQFGALDENGVAIEEYGGTLQLMQSLILYDGVSWTTSPQWIFEYADNPDGSQYGDLTKITFPTGGSITYSWDTTGPCQAQGPVTPMSRFVTKRLVDANDGTVAQQWQYSGPLNTTGNVLATGTKVTSPQGNDTVHFFTDLGFQFGRSGYHIGCNYFETETQWFSGSQTQGTLLKEVDTHYRVTPTHLPSPDGNDLIVVTGPDIITTKLPNGKVSRVERDYVDSDGVTGTAQFTDVNGTALTLPLGDLIEEREFDYGQGAAGPLVRRTHYQYKAFQDSGYYNLNTLDRVASVTVSDGGGNMVSQITNGYDANPFSLQPSGVSSASLDTSFGPNRGNLTSVTKWISSTGGSVTSTTSYYDTGMPFQVTDPNHHATTYFYSLDYNGAYVTQTQMPDTHSPNLAHHIVSGTYDLNTGLLASFTDQNNLLSNYVYDPLGRMKSATFPDGGGATFNYPDFVTVERKQNLDSSRSTDIVVQFDGLGRQTRKAIFNGQSPNAWDLSDTCYYGDGTVKLKAYAYQAASNSGARDCAGTTHPGDTFSYDGMGRVTQVLHSDGTHVDTQYTGAATQTQDEGNGSIRVSRISQTDALGRLRSVCEVSAANNTANPVMLGIGAAPSACGQDIAATGYLTQYGYNALGNLTSVSQPGMADRVFHYDGLSRLTDATNPETGTVSYTYDPDSLVATRTRPAPNQTNPAATVTTDYGYDELHRKLTVGYTDGTTPSATFNYDEATAAGHGTVNPIGHLTSEVTSNTGEYLWNFDPMGRPQGRTQCLPSTANTAICGQNYDFTYGYDLLGNELSEGLPTNISLNSSYNQAGKLLSYKSTQSDSTHPEVLLSDVQYGPFGVVGANIGGRFAEQMTYSARGWLAGATDNNVGMTTPAGGSMTISGSEQPFNDPGQSAAAGSGTVTISGALQSKQVQTAAATGSTGTITISGTEKRVSVPDCPPHQLCFIYDSGTVSAFINGNTANAGYGQGSTAGGIAAALASAINAAGAGVTASSNGGTISLASGGTGSATNYSLAVSVSYDEGDFTSASFTPTASGATMTGGADAQFQTVYDTGNVTIMANGHSDSATFGAGSTPTSIASGLVSAINADTAASVTATSSAGTVTLTAKTQAASTNNYTLSSSTSYDSSNFTGPSFAATSSGANLTGGRDFIAPSTTWDSGAITATVGNISETALFGQNSTPATVASDLAASFHADVNSTVDATAANGIITFTGKGPQGGSNYSFSVSSTYNTQRFSHPSFTGTSGSLGSGVSSQTAVYSFSIPTAGGFAPNGNILQANDAVNGNWAYTYDSFNRLSSAVSSNKGLGCGWLYDRYGNRWQQNPYTGTCGSDQRTYTMNGAGTNNNRMDGASYDVLGNLLANPVPGGASYTYDADSRLTQVVNGGVTTKYLYDAEGRRVAKLSGTTVTNEYLFDTDGSQQIELNGSGAVLHTNLYAGGKLIATYQGTNTYFHFTDWLGTRRYEANSAGAQTEICTNLPFGDNQVCTGAPDATEQHFTGKEHDSESGLDYFGARYYANVLGRWNSPDWSELPVAVPFAEFRNPQSLNLFAYVKNNPIMLRDSAGHSDLVYDGKAKTITLYSGTGQKIGSWHANNRVDSHATLHGLPNGKYKFQDTKTAHHHPGNDQHGVPKDSAKGEFGSFGIFRLEPFKADGTSHEGVGVHSGREGVPDKSAEHGEGADHVTEGCLRTCDPAMHQITETAQTDPLNTLTVENNRQIQPQMPGNQDAPPAQGKDTGAQPGIQSEKRP